MGGEMISEHLAIALLSQTILPAKNVDLLAFESGDPRTYKEAMNSPSREQWKAAMREENASLLQNNTWLADALRTPEELERLEEAIPIGCRWVFKLKRNAENTFRLKVRLIIKGCEQRPGMDYEETYAPVSKLTTLQCLLSTAATNRWTV
jgi:hypothetical protein